MEIICENCQGKFKIADEKLTPGKTVNFRCPKCKKKISITPEDNTEKNYLTDMDFQEDDTYGINNDDYDVTEKPFDFIEEEGKIALICETDSNIVKAVSDTLYLMEYHITEVENVREALKKIRYYNYDLIIINERFDTKKPDSNSMLIYLERLEMSIRRKTFVCLITDRYRTMDRMMAFNKSVNLIINIENMNEVARILKHGLTENEFFYQIYKDKMKKLNKY